MADNREFVASMKSEIAPDVDHIREHDELLKSFGEGVKNSPAVFLLFLTAAAALFFVNKIAMAVCALIGAGALYSFIRKKKVIRQSKSSEYLKEVYEEGLLVPGLIVKTEPLTVLVLAVLTALEDCEDRYGCYSLRIEHLPGAQKTLYEKIPCVCMFRYGGGNYHSSFQPHPLYWGTGNQEEIRAALRRLEDEQEENEEDEWEVLKRISAAYPDIKPDHILQLDASYRPIGIKYYLDDEFTPLVTAEVRARYPKTQPDVSHITDDIPAATVYNKMIDLAVQYQVYEYVGTHCKDEDYAPLTNPGYFTYIGDPLTFLGALDRRNIVLAEEEYPLLAGSALLTTKGCWKKKEFTPWQSIVLDAVISSDGEIETRVNGKCIVQFKVNTKYYQNKESFTKKDMLTIRQIELEGINHFLLGLRELQGER